MELSIVIENFYLTCHFIFSSLVFSFYNFIHLVLKIISIAIINYRLILRWNRPLINWTFNIVILFLIEWITLPLMFSSTSSFSFRLPFLSSFSSVLMILWKGLLPRWNVTFNFTLLRLLSFSLDYHASNGRDGDKIQWKQIKDHCEKCEKCSLDPNAFSNSQSLHLFPSLTSFQSSSPSIFSSMAFSCSSCEKYRIICNPKSWDLESYLAYLFYIPLFLAGPIITFNDFTNQSRNGKNEEYYYSRSNWKKILFYTIRWIVAFFLLEIMMHLFHVIAIKDSYSWRNNFTPPQFAVLGFWNLKIIWLKLLIIWRFFRLVAMIDGIQVGENMIRCMCNNYSGLGFWRGWHRTFNQWIIRYIYIPLGGSKTVWWNIWIVFGFVAIWHDIQLRLLIWGWLICLFLIPEFLISKLGAGSNRWISGIGAASNIFLMMTANLVGFVIGPKDMKIIIESFNSREGILYLISFWCCFYAASQIMFEWRRGEDKQGLERNY